MEQSGDFVVPDDPNFVPTVNTIHHFFTHMREKKSNALLVSQESVGHLSNK